MASDEAAAVRSRHLGGPVCEPHSCRFDETRPQADDNNPAGTADDSEGKDRTWRAALPRTC